MEFFDAAFQVDFFNFCLRLAAAGTACGVLLPFGFWALGMVVQVFSRIVKSA